MYLEHLEHESHRRLGARPASDRYSETKQLFLQPRDKRTTPVGSILRLYLRSLVYERPVGRHLGKEEQKNVSSIKG